MRREAGASHGQLDGVDAAAVVEGHERGAIPVQNNPRTTRSKEEIDQYLQEERASWES
jgi:hypothetical protein